MLKQNETHRTVPCVLTLKGVIVKTKKWFIPIILVILIVLLFIFCLCSKDYYAKRAVTKYYEHKFEVIPLNCIDLVSYSKENKTYKFHVYLNRNEIGGEGITDEMIFVTKGEDEYWVYNEEESFEYAYPVLYW